MAEVYDLLESSQRLGITLEQLRLRLRLLGQIIEPHKKVGKKGKLLLTEDGLFVLARLMELEKKGQSVQDAAQAVAEELGKSPETTDYNGQQALSRLRPEQAKAGLSLDAKEALERLIKKLEEENQFLKDRIHFLESILQQRLPPSQEEAKTKRWWHFFRR